MKNILIITMLIFISCDDEKVEEQIPIPDLTDICNNEYNNVDGSLVSCDDDCSLFNDDCYHNYDIDLLSVIKENNESLIDTLLLNIGNQIWEEGRLKSLNLSNLELSYIPEDLCNIDCYINVDSNSLCDEYFFECIDDFGLQIIDGCTGYTEYSGEWYYDSDIEVLSVIKENNESLNEIVLLEIGEQSWVSGRLIELNLSGNQLISLPESLCNLSSNCYINVSNNQLCQEFQYDCIDVWGTQSGLEIMDDCGICNGNNQSMDECGVCNGNNSTCLGCDGVPNSGLVVDECGVCGGDGLNDNNCCDGEVKLWNNCYNVEETTSLWIYQGSRTIPPEIDNLINLTDLYFAPNILSGEIPPEIGNLINLTRINFSLNNLTGEIPSEIGNLTNLEFLYLEENQLSGEIPSSLGNLTNLVRIYLDRNELTGSIPSEIGNLINAENIYLHYNQLSGTIPLSVCNLIENNDCCLDINNFIEGNNLTNTCD